MKFSTTVTGKGPEVLHERDDGEAVEVRARLASCTADCRPCITLLCLRGDGLPVGV
jgi:hypothetical protein